MALIGESDASVVQYEALDESLPRGIPRHPVEERPARAPPHSLDRGLFAVTLRMESSARESRRSSDLRVGRSFDKKRRLGLLQSNGCLG